MELLQTTFSSTDQISDKWAAIAAIVAFFSTIATVTASFVALWLPIRIDRRRSIESAELIYTEFHRISKAIISASANDDVTSIDIPGVGITEIRKETVQIEALKTIEFTEWDAHGSRLASFHPDVYSALAAPYSSLKKLKRDLEYPQNPDQFRMYELVACSEMSFYEARHYIPCKDALDKLGLQKLIASNDLFFGYLAIAVFSSLFAFLVALLILP